jgi:hypothetical protein
MEAKLRKLLDQVRDVIRLKHYSYRTEQSYVYSTQELFSYVFNIRVAG